MMKLPAGHHRPFGNTGLRIPPIIFGTSVLANARRVIPEQTKLELCGEWFRHVPPPVAIDTSLQYSDGGALEVLARAFQRLDISSEEVVLINRISCQGAPTAYDAIQKSNDAARRMLGANHCPQLAAIDSPDDYLAAAQSPADRDQRFQDVLDAYRALDELKTAGRLAGVGVAANDWKLVQLIDSAVRLDWLMLIGCFTILRHPPELLDFMSSLAARQIPIVGAGVFHCDFLTGGSSVDGRAVSPENPADQSLFAWRKAFVALCHGHAVTPVHACIQFALLAPGVVAVTVNTSHPDRIAENVASTVAIVPGAFWASMKEERLLADDYPYLG